MAGCTPRQSAQAPQPRYLIGPAYQAGGVWRYPAEDFQYDATGVATVLPDRGGLTANGESSDPAAMAAAHPTLQLPALAQVTNLDTGAQLTVRINDRGPDNPARVIGLTRAAAARLGLQPGGTGRVRVQVDSGPSQALRDALGGGAGAIAAAPRGGVSSEALPPPPGIGQSSRGRSVASAPAPTAPAADAAEASRPGTLVQGAPAPGRLWIRAGEFGLRAYADQVVARLGGAAAVEAGRAGRGQVFRVRAGPFPDVGAADSALDRMVRAGVTDARIVVE